MDSSSTEFRRQFFQEVRDIIDKVSEDALRAEAEPENPELVNAIFRGIHTIKGSAGVFDLDELSTFAHHLEGILNLVRDGQAPIDSDIIDMVLQGGDALLEMVEEYESGETPTPPAEIVARFQSWSAGRAEAKTSPVKTAEIVTATPELDTQCQVPPKLLLQLRDQCTAGQKMMRVVVNYPDDFFANGYDPLIFLSNLKEASSFYAARADAGGVPDLASFNPLACYLVPEVFIVTDLDRAGVLDLALEPDFIEVVDLSAALQDGAEVTASASYRLDEDSLKEFLSGAEDLLSRLEQAIIAYERRDDGEALNEIFRIVHTIKGDADYIGLAPLVTFAHALETMLEKLRGGRLRRTDAVIDLILKGLDYIQDVVRGLAAGSRTFELPGVHQSLAEFAEVADYKQEDVSLFSSGGVPRETSVVFIEQARQHRDILTRHTCHQPLDSGDGKIVRRSLAGLGKAAAYVGAIPLEKLCRQGLEALESGQGEVFERSVGDLIACLQGLDDEPKKLGELLVEDGRIDVTTLNATLDRQKKIGDLLIEEGVVEEVAVTDALRRQQLMVEGAQIKKAQTAASSGESRTMRVDEGKIDQFSNTLGELVVARNGLEYLIHSLGTLPGVPPALLKSFKDNLHRVSRVSNDMQADVMALRMIPIKGIFQKFARVVRDIGKSEEKQIDFILDGEETEIDKKIADILSEPLIHMVRNSCDHGLETPAERCAAGKPEKGTLLLKAAQEGSNLLITINDDGRGIDREKLRAKAEKQGFPVAEENDEALLKLIFMPGLSTREQVSDLSGRGVGMDVVNSSLKQLGGTIQVASEQGQGTLITLTIPMTMGISEALLVEAGGKPYAVPLDYVDETVKLPANRLRRIHDRLGFHYRGEVIPVERLEALLDIEKGPGENELLHATVQDREISLVILRSNRGKFAAVVDKLNKNLELAIKPVPDVLAGIDVVSGVSILVDGNVVLVLNPEKMV